MTSESLKRILGMLAEEFVQEQDPSLNYGEAAAVRHFATWLGDAPRLLRELER